MRTGVLHPATGPTDIFLKPGDAVRGTDALVTNFHLPGSSLFMLVSALMGTDVMRAAYAHAIANEYRFYSYGDACLLLP
jgi:S-adenosylmethionine:tRNA ribosyltransferase-isomerase